MLSEATLLHFPSPHSGTDTGVPIACIKFDIALSIALLIVCPSAYLSCNAADLVGQESSQPAPGSITG